IRDSWHFPTFNVADMLVVIGAGLMILFILLIEPKIEAKKQVGKL
ncbi:MAG: signal peptidase II, partial [Clostridium sp.]|nr:signal peptidase II [Clostridium sp.]